MRVPLKYCCKAFTQLGRLSLALLIFLFCSISFFTLCCRSPRPWQRTTQPSLQLRLQFYCAASRLSMTGRPMVFWLILVCWKSWLTRLRSIRHLPTYRVLLACCWSGLGRYVINFISSVRCTLRLPVVRFPFECLHCFFFECHLCIAKLDDLFYVPGIFVVSACSTSHGY